MAFDAAATVQAPTQGAGASAKSAARQGGVSDPFGALLAMLDGAQTKTPPVTSSSPTTTVPADIAAQAVSPVRTDAGKVVPADADAPTDVVVSDPATLVAAMMIAPPAVTPVTAAPVAESAAPAAPPAPADAETAVIADDGAPAADSEAAAEPAPKNGSLAQPSQAAQAERPAQTQLAAAPVQTAPTPTPVATPTVAVEPQPAQAPVEAAQPRMTANDKPADAPRAAAAVDTDIAANARTGVQDQQGQQSDTGADGQPSNAEASQQARRAASPAPAADAVSFAAAAPIAPEAPAPAVGVAQAATPAVVIAAQAAATPVRGAPETVAHLAAQMIQRLDGQTTRFDLTLNPQSLGRVDVRIEIGAKGALRARMAFDDAATAQEMSGRHTELRAALQSAGFDVPEGALSFDVASGGGGAFAERQDADHGATPVFQNLADTADQTPAAAIRNYFSAAGPTGVDIRI